MYRWNCKGDFCCLILFKSCQVSLLEPCGQHYVVLCCRWFHSSAAVMNVVKAHVKGWGIFYALTLHNAGGLTLPRDFRVSAVGTQCDHSPSKPWNVKECKEGQRYVWDFRQRQGKYWMVWFYCNMVEWFWWDSSLISTTNWFPSVLWHCWFGHLACKNRPRNDLLCVEWDVKPLHYYLAVAVLDGVEMWGQLGL